MFINNQNYEDPIVLTVPEDVTINWKNNLLNYKDSFSSNEDLLHFLTFTRKSAVINLPDAIQEVLNLVRDHWISPAFIHIKNLPIDDISNIPSPNHGFLSEYKLTRVAEAAQMGIAQLIGNPYAFQDERREAGIIHVIAPRDGQEKAQTSESSEVPLSWHVEHCFSTTLRPSFVILFCLRPDRDRNAATSIVDIRKAIPHLKKTHLEILRKPIFTFMIPDSIGKAGKMSSPMPIISGNIKHPKLSYSLPGKMFIESDSQELISEANVALKQLSDLFESPALQHNIFLDSGEMLIINNHLSVHGRSIFKSYDDGYNRWMHRIIVCESLYEARNDMSSKYRQFRVCY